MMMKKPKVSKIRWSNLEVLQNNLQKKLVTKQKAQVAQIFHANVVAEVVLAQRKMNHQL